MTSSLRVSDLTPAECAQYAVLCERMDDDEALEWIAAGRCDPSGLGDEAARDAAGRDAARRPEPLKPALRALIRIVARSAMRPKLPQPSVVPQNPQSR